VLLDAYGNRGKAEWPFQFTNAENACVFGAIYTYIQASTLAAI